MTDASNLRPRPLVIFIDDDADTMMPLHSLIPPGFAARAFTRLHSALHDIALLRSASVIVIDMLLDAPADDGTLYAAPGAIAHLRELGISAPIIVFSQVDPREMFSLPSDVIYVPKYLATPREVALVIQAAAAPMD